MSPSFRPMLLVLLAHVLLLPFTAIPTGASFSCATPLTFSESRLPAILQLENACNEKPVAVCLEFDSVVYLIHLMSPSSLHTVPTVLHDCWVFRATNCEGPTLLEHSVIGTKALKIGCTKALTDANSVPLDTSSTTLDCSLTITPNLQDAFAASKDAVPLHLQPDLAEDLLFADLNNPIQFVASSQLLRGLYLMCAGLARHGVPTRAAFNVFRHLRAVLLHTMRCRPELVGNDVGIAHAYFAVYGAAFANLQASTDLAGLWVDNPPALTSTQQTAFDALVDYAVAIDVTVTLPDDALPGPLHGVADPDAAGTNRMLVQRTTPPDEDKSFGLEPNTQRALSHVERTERAIAFATHLAHTFPTRAAEEGDDDSPDSLPSHALPSLYGIEEGDAPALPPLHRTEEGDAPVLPPSHRTKEGDAPTLPSLHLTKGGDAPALLPSSVSPTRTERSTALAAQVADILRPLHDAEDGDEAPGSPLADDQLPLPHAEKDHESALPPQSSHRTERPIVPAAQPADIVRPLHGAEDYDDISGSVVPDARSRLHRSRMSVTPALAPHRRGEPATVLLAQLADILRPLRLPHSTEHGTDAAELPAADEPSLPPRTKESNAAGLAPLPVALRQQAAVLVAQLADTLHSSGQDEDIDELAGTVTRTTSEGQAICDEGEENGRWRHFRTSKTGLAQSGADCCSLACFTFGQVSLFAVSSFLTSCCLSCNKGWCSEELTARANAVFLVAEVQMPIASTIKLNQPQGVLL